MHLANFITNFIKRYYEYIILLGIAIIIRQLIYQHGIRHDKQVIDPFLDVENKSNTIYVDRVTTPELIAKGLMFRKGPLAQNQGMLFDKGTWSSSGFWMKNTYIPLDILFLDDTFTVIDILYDMKPLDTTSRNINKPWRYAIEINAGTMRHIIPGSHVDVIDT
jgi:uncharacterized membrane protein (UPF0127 family)